MCIRALELNFDDAKWKRCEKSICAQNELKQAELLLKETLDICRQAEEGKHDYVRS